MGLHRRFAEKLALCDLGIAEPTCRQQEDIALPRGEAAEFLRFGGLRSAAIEVLEEFPGGGCRDDGVAGVNSADGRQEELRIGVLEHESACAATNCPSG